jgi:2-haloacid dehalogenase
MIGQCLANSGLADFFGRRISADEVRVFKPSPVVYRHAAERLAVPIGQIRLVTCNPFDSVGAGAAGMRTAWVNRSAAPFDTIGAQPDLTVAALDRLPAALGRWRDESIRTAPARERLHGRVDAAPPAGVDGHSGARPREIHW